jgi:hypothetical protein
MRRILNIVLLFAICISSGYSQEAGSSAIVGGKRWAIVVGAGDYEVFSKLRYTVSGAKAFASKLIENYGFSDDSVKVLVDDAAPKLTPTAGHILGELSVFLQDRRLDKSDLFIFYFSGHGMGLKSGDYLVPLDARPATVEQLGVPVKKVIEQFVAAGLKNVLIIADACRSGSENPFGTELQQLADKANIAVMLGCKPGQVSREDPKLKSGIFSHFLIQALDDAAIRDPNSGAVWVTSISKQVSETAHKFGQREYGEYSQQPTAWTDPTRDVLLGVFPTSQSGDQELKSFLFSAQKLNKEAYVSALNEYAVRLFYLDRLRETIEVCKVLDQLGQLSPDSRYMYSVSLSVLDRELEAVRVIAKFGDDVDSFFYKNLSIASSSSDAIPADEKINSAAIAWLGSKSWAIGQIRWILLKYHGVPDQKREFLKELIEFVGAETRQGIYLDAEFALVEGDSERAAARFEDAKRAKGSDPDDYNIDLAVHGALAAAGNSKKLEDFLKNRMNDPRRGYIWAVLLAKHYALYKESELMMQALRSALEGPISATYLWLTVKYSGARAGELAAEIKRAAANHPFVWRALLAEQMATAIHDKGLGAAFENYEKPPEFLEEKAAFTFESISFLWTVWQAAVAEGKAKEEDSQIFIQSASADMTKYAADLEQDTEFWELYYELMLRGEKAAILGQIVRKYFEPEKSVDTIRSEIRPYLLMIYANARDASGMDSLSKAGGILFRDDFDSKLLSACYYAIENRLDDARATLPRKGQVSSVLESLRLATEGLLLAKEGKKIEAKKIADSLQETVDLQTQPMVGLIYEVLEDWENAKLFFHASRVQRSWGFNFVHLAALRSYFELCVRTGDRDLQEQLHYEMAMNHPANEWGKEMFSGQKSEISNFVGTTEWKISGNADWSEPMEGTMTLTVTPSGKVTGIAELGGDVSATIFGTADKFGTVRGKVKIKSIEYDLNAKLFESAFLDKNEQMKQLGSLFHMLRKDYLRIVWFCKPVPTIKSR